MNQKVSPALAGVVVVALIAVVALVGFRMLGGSAKAGSGEKPPGMPADAAAEFQKRLGSANPTNPGSKGPGPGAPGAGYLAPPTPGR
jgi:hypothetical protein